MWQQVEPELVVRLLGKYEFSHVKHNLDKLGLSSEKYNGHSFHSGAATSDHKARLEDHLIQTLGFVIRGIFILPQKSYDKLRFKFI
jgi:hypothetical protein